MRRVGGGTEYHLKFIAHNFFFFHDFESVWFRPLVTRTCASATLDGAPSGSLYTKLSRNVGVCRNSVHCAAIVACAEM